MPASSFFNPLEFAQSFAKKISEGYKTTDKALGGWLPGGGTVSPITPSIRRFTEKARDQVVVPAIDEGLRRGVLPTKETMFARYLTGTSKPLTTYPPQLLKNISEETKQSSSPGNTTFDYARSYAGNLPEDIKLSLGMFNVKNNVIEDRYQFDNLEAGRHNLDQFALGGSYDNTKKRNVYADAAEGGPMASNLIELGLKTGIINPKSGYDVRIPLRQ
jgi:hypothetical protein